jgi:hypothetical protein
VAGRSLRRSVLALITVVPLGAGACTPDTIDPSSSRAGDETSLSFVHMGLSVEAVLTLTAVGGTLRVTNDTGTVLDAPGITVLDARNGERVELSVEPSSRIVDGDRRTFEISIVEGTVDLGNVGLVLLRFGQDGYGAFEPEAGQA